jgi:hypothetical protein
MALGTVGSKKYLDPFNEYTQKLSADTVVRSMQTCVRIHKLSYSKAKYTFDVELQEFVDNSGFDDSLFWHVDTTARVQPIKSTVFVTGDDQYYPKQTWLFSIRTRNRARQDRLDSLVRFYDEEGLQLGQKVHIFGACNNPELKKYPFAIIEIGDSNNLVERTFICQQDLSVRNG